MADIVTINPTFIGSPAIGVDTYQVPSEAMVAIGDIINATWNEGKASKEEFTAKITAAMAGFLDLTAAPQVTAGSVAPISISEPAVSIPASANVTDAMDLFDTKYLELVDLLYNKLIDFRAAYFPDEQNAYVAAENWLQAAISDPTGLPSAFTTALLTDAEAQVLGESARAADAAIAQFASRGFPLPPDAAASAVMQIEQKAQDLMAESSRKIILTAIENMRANIKDLLSLRQIAMSSAIDYIKALASGPDMASRLISVGYDAQSKLISAASSFYNARTQAAETISKVQQYNNSTALEADIKNQAAELAQIENKLRALLAEAQTIGQIATSLMNNVHASANMSVSGGVNGSVISQ